MEQIRISDMTMKQSGKGFSLSFKEKIEISKLLDKLGVSVIELEPIVQMKIDALRIKSVASTVKHSIVAVPVDLTQESIDATWNALKEAKYPRLQVCASVNTVQMEYLFKKKPEAMLQAIEETIAACCLKTADVEFVADDATRSDAAFLYRAIRTAICAGAKTVTVCDATGSILPDELGAFVNSLYENVPELSSITLGLSCLNELAMADACAIAAIKHGVREIKAAAYPINRISLSNVSRLLAAKGDVWGVSCPVRTVEMNRIVKQIAWMCETSRSKNSPFDNGVKESDNEIALTTLGRDVFIARAINLGACYYMVKPFDFDLLAQRIFEAAGEEALADAMNIRLVPEQADAGTGSLEERIANLFLTVGILAHIKGYQYLREAVKMVIENPDLMSRITKELYPGIAHRFGTTSSKVERAIRHAIEVAWNRGRIEALDEAFGKNVCSLDDKPTNGEFIALCSSKISMKNSA